MKTLSEYDERKDFTSLEAWKKAKLNKLFFYKEVIPVLPVEEKYNLCEQMRRASLSITSNISEGYGRYHYQEGIQFYRIARGSMYELKDHLISCYDLNFIDRETLEKGILLIENAKRTLNGYIKFVHQREEPTPVERAPPIPLYPYTPILKQTLSLSNAKTTNHTPHINSTVIHDISVLR